jgi:hypothetical protein
MTVLIAVLLAFGAGFMVRPFVEVYRQHDLPSDFGGKYGSLTRDHDYD